MTQHSLADTGFSAVCAMETELFATHRDHSATDSTQDVDLADDEVSLFEPADSQPHSVDPFHPAGTTTDSESDAVVAKDEDIAQAVLDESGEDSDRRVTLELQDAFPLPLTYAQQEIVRSVREAPLTVATGPPGTGKSYTITAVVLDAMLRGQSVLIASQMDKAVQIVADQVEKIAGPYAIARSGGRAVQRQLAEKITRLTGPRSGLGHRSRKERLDTVRQHASLSERLDKLEQRYHTAIEQEEVWHESSAAFERLEPICPLPVHDIDAADHRCASGAMRRVRSASGHDSGPIRFPGQAPLRTYVHARQLIRKVRQLLSGKSGLWSRLGAVWLTRKAVRLFKVKARRPCTHQDVERALRHWWRRWNHQRTLDALKVPDSWGCSLDDIDEALLVQGHKVAMQSAERDLRGAFPLDLLWQEIEHLDGQRTETALQLLQLNREATLYSLIQSAGDKCSLCNGTGREECDTCFGSGHGGKCNRCGGDGLWGSSKCTTCNGTGISSCSACHGKGVSRKHCAPCKGKGRIKAGRHHLRLFRTLLRRRDRKLKQELREQIDLDIPLRAFPAWACTNRSLEQVLPAKPGLFDLVILDEASQCDLATAAVALFRGKRALVVGDPQQLRHVSFLSRAREQASFIRHQFNVAFQERVRYRRSLFDIASDAVLQSNFFLLDQHFRSHPHIIFFTTSVDTNCHSASLRFLQNPNLFNVAITRARHELVTITSVTPDNLRPGLLREFLWHTERLIQPQPVTDAYETAFQKKVTAELRKQKLIAWPNYRSSGVRIDLVVSDGSGHLAVLLDGSECDTGGVSPLVTHRILVRAGWRVTRLSPRSWKTSWYDCLEHIRTILHQ